MEQQLINMSVADGVGRLELNRPERRNALSVALCRAIVDGVGSVLAGGARAIMITAPTSERSTPTVSATPSTPPCTP